MKNKTTYEMSDIMGLITRDLEEKGLALDSETIEIRAKTAEGDTLGDVGPLREIEIDVNVSWVGIPTRGDARTAAPRARDRREPDLEAEPAPQDLFDEAPRPGGGPVLEIGIDEVTAASTRIARSGGPGPFSPERVKRRLTDGESTEYPGTPTRGR